MKLTISKEGSYPISVNIDDTTGNIKSVEGKLNIEDRNNLPDSSFGIPELRKYPLTDADHVRSAISYFGKAPAKYKHELAVRICRAAKKFGVEISKDSPVWKEAHK